MALVFIRHLGNNLAYVHTLEGVDPGFGVGGGGVDPGWGQGHPGGHPDAGLPWAPGHPGNRPPGSWDGSRPDNTLPSQPPPQIKPGYLLVLARGADGKWHYAALAPGSAPPKPLPEPLPPDAGTKPVDPDAPLPPGSVAPPIAPTPAPKA